jgi:hypothetical protein
MNALSKRIGVMVASAAVAFGLAAVAAPVASAETVATARPSSWWCKPAHTGPNWRWDDGRRWGHWDERVWDRQQHRWEWKHQWRDSRYCAPVRNDGPPRQFDGPPAHPQGPPANPQGPGPRRP